LTVDAEETVSQVGLELRKSALQFFRNRYAGKTNLRILVHIPDPDISPAGSFLFENLRKSLDFIGIPTARLNWNSGTHHALETFQPNVILTSDHHSYLERIDWVQLESYRKKKPTLLGLTASLAEYGNSPLAARLAAARKRNVDFFYSFRSPNYIAERAEYRPFMDHGYQILSVEFGANVIDYYPVPGIRRDIPYVFFGSINPDKTDRYIRYFSKIFSSTAGYIEGVGWRNFDSRSSAASQRLIYARAIVGINLHLPEQIKWANELNERTYILAACGVPQIIDTPALLADRFSRDSFFIGGTPREYRNAFSEALNNPKLRSEKALKALKQVYERHTTLHRAAKLVEDLTSLHKMP
jgi:hypothetical protein